MDRQRVISIYGDYFEIIDSYFGSMKKYLGIEDDNHVDLGIEIANYPLVSDLILDSLYELEKDIREFWVKNAKDLFEYIRGRDALRCLYSGDVTPYNLEHFIKKSALYIDIVIVPDPIFNLTRPGLLEYLDKYYYLSKLVRHVFNVWKMHKLVMNNSDIIFIMPISLEITGREKCEELFAKSEINYSHFFEKVTGTESCTPEIITKILGSANTIAEIFSTFKQPSMLPSNLRNPDSLERFFKSFLRGVPSSAEHSLGNHLDNYLRSQFIRVQEHRHFCRLASAEPIYDYEPPWHFFNSVMGGRGIDGSIASALQTEQFQWISKVPLQALVVFREEEDLSYMRSILRRGITDLKAESDKDLSIVSQQLQDNLQEAFRIQDSEIKSLSDKAQAITHKEIPITASGFLAGFIPGLNQVISFLLAGRDVKKHLKKKDEIETKLRDKRSSFINLLMRTNSS